MSDSEESDIPPLRSKYTAVYLVFMFTATQIVSEGMRLFQVPPKWAFIAGLPYTFGLLVVLVWIKRWYVAEREVRKYSVE